MQANPLAHELKSATREIADQHGAAVDCDYRMMLAVLSVEMRRFVIVEVHRDYDAVEGADSWHDAMMNGGSDDRCGDQRPALPSEASTATHHGPRATAHSAPQQSVRYLLLSFDFCRFFEVQFVGAGKAGLFEAKRFRSAAFQFQYGFGLFTVFCFIFCWCLNPFRLGKGNGKLF